jgi:uncharacterized protein YdeI (YjbR/CyaY-like superfamily)
MPPEYAEDGLELFYTPDRAAWRAWLEANHTNRRGVWLVYYKKESGKPRVAYDDAVEEALCFGWVDSVPNRIDEDRFRQLFSPRSVKSPWSALNKRRVEQLIAQGRMTPAGLAKIEAAKANGMWDAYDAIEALTVPDDLRAALDAVPAAATHFDGFSPSSKKNILWWIESARKPETRARRIAETVEKAAHGLKANHPRQ